VVCSLPDSASAAAIAVAVAATGTFSHFETHELISPEDMLGILARAKDISYRPVGG
jgi:hypothetical protein